MSMRENLRKIFGDERTSFDESNGSWAVRPMSFDEVKRLVGMANEKKFALIPCSSGGSDGNGASADSVIVDLSGMKTIRRIDRRNKVAMIEPGVTFGELKAAVEKEGLRLEMPLLPRKTQSVVASLLEREPTTGPKYNWDAIDPLCCLELVFGAGDHFRTGNAAGPGTLEQQWASGQAQKVSMGPAQMDIGRIVQGAQGTLAIATWATIKLEQMPKIRKGFLAGGDSIEELSGFAYRLLWRKLPDLCLLLNNVSLAAISGKDSSELPPWVLVYSLSGLSHFPEERISYMEQDITDIAREMKVTPQRNLHGLSADLMVETMNGVSEEPYWKKRKAGACRELFFLTTLDRSHEFVKSVSGLAKDNGLSADRLGIYIQPIRHGSGCHLEFDFMFDPASGEEKKKVERLYIDAGRACLEQGAFFSRPPMELSAMVYKKCPDTVSALKKVKNIFDPRGVLSPGRLCLGKEA